MSMMAITAGQGFHPALTGFAMRFGVVPNGIGPDGFLFGSIDEPQAEILPLVNTDGALEETSRIHGFPPMRWPAEGEACRFHRDWLHLTAMLDLPLRRLVYGIDGSEHGRAEGEAREPALGGLETLTVRQALEMVAKGAADVAKVREIGGYLYLMGGQEARPAFAASLFFASGVMLMKTGNEKLAIKCIETAAARLPDDHASGKAILYEMSTAALETAGARRSVAKQWMKALKEDPSPVAHDIKLFRAMWNAWRAGDLSMMRDLMSIYMVSRRGRGDLLETARSCVRIAWLTSEAAEVVQGESDTARERMSSRTQLDVASSLFKRAGDEESAIRALEIADMVE